MRVLILASYAQSLINFRGPLIRDILAAGHRVSVGAPRIAPDLRSRLEALGAEVYETPLQRTGTGLLADLRYGAALRRLMAEISPDIVLTYTIKPNIWGAFAAARRGIPSVAMVTGLGYAFTDSETASLKQRLVRSIARRFYRASTNRNCRVIFQNPDDRNDFLAAGCLADPGKIAMVNGSGVDLNHYARAPLPDEPVFLMIARLLKNKGVREYAKAARMVRQDHPEARCLLVGAFDEGPDGIAKADLDRLIAGGLEYLGSLNDVRPALAQARVYVLPSYREGTPRSVLEAMAMGRPIITTDVPGCRETVEHNHNGLLVPPRDSAALAQAMLDLIHRPDTEIRKMADASLRMAQEKFDVNRVNEEILRITGL